MSYEPEHPVHTHFPICECCHRKLVDDALVLLCSECFGGLGVTNTTVGSGSRFVCSIHSRVVSESHRLEITVLHPSPTLIFLA